MKLILLLICSLRTVLAIDQCASTTQRKPGDCCNIANSVAFTSMFHSPVCRQLVPWPSDAPPSTFDADRHHICRDECIFSENRLLTEDLELDMAKVVEVFMSSDEAMRPVLNSTVENCMFSYKSHIRATSECLSGAYEFSKCVFREIFINCPVKFWTDNKECDGLKSQAIKCPEIHLKLWRRGPPRFFD
uniref:Odorant-binding protein 19 n=1 Tax=Matsumurasca onukii TaxID=2912585 RepID=A0A343WGY1_MATON|nr:odorant-binding protein 19 [Matsumurasca onukii]